MGKSVSFSTVTVYEFGVALGGSAVPRRGGPSIGLARTPLNVWTTRVDTIEDKRPTQTKETTRRTTRNRVRWLKPLERVTMLEKAGYSEKRILRMLLESSSIAQSRRLCLRVTGA